MEKIKVLVAVPDHNLSNHICQLVDAYDDFVSVRAHTVMEALGLLTCEIMPDIFILDISLNGDKIDSVTLLHLIVGKTHPPIFVVGNNISKEDEIRYFTFGAWNVLNYPIPDGIFNSFLTRYKNVVLRIREREMLVNRIGELEAKVKVLEQKTRRMFYAIIFLAIFAINVFSIDKVPIIIDFITKAVF